jgi:ribosomal protein S18 acetylase RimI-like enzyme
VIVSAQKGSGEIILATLAGLTEDPSIVVEVSAENIPAMKLYQKMGFIKTSEIARWHKVFG